MNHLNQITFHVPNIMLYDIFGFAVWALVLLGMLDIMVSKVLHIIKIWKCFLFGVCLVRTHGGYGCPCGYKGMGAQELEILGDEKNEGDTKEEEMKEGEMEDLEMEELVMDVGVFKEVVIEERMPEEVITAEGVVKMQDSMGAKLKERDSGGKGKMRVRRKCVQF
jgi:hypothetical protein